MTIQTNLTKAEVQELRTLIGNANDFRWDKQKSDRIIELMRKDFKGFKPHYLWVYSASDWAYMLEKDGYVEVSAETLLEMVEGEWIRLWGGPVNAVSKRSGRFVDLSLIDRTEGGKLVIEVSYAIDCHARDLGATNRTREVGAKAYRFFVTVGEFEKFKAEKTAIEAEVA